MVLFIVENYRKIYPDLEGKPLTDRLVAELLSQNLPDRSKVKIQIQRTESGKPYVVWNRDQQAPCISVSHCDGVFACAFDDENVGIDIQNERDVAADRIKGRYFTEAEQSEDFYKMWTRKEAYSKYTGRGLTQIIEGAEVLNLRDVTFDDFMILDRIHVSVCRPASKDRGENYEIQFFDRKQDR